MNRYLLGSAVLVMLAGAANAADMPVKAMPVKAPPVIAYDWTGTYIGAYFGDSIGSAKAHTDADTSGVNDLNQKGLTAGATVGYNWQFDPRWLVGLEGDIGWLGLNRSIVDWNDTVNVGEKADWYGTARVRFGYVTGPSLLYVTGGGAFVHLRDTFGGSAVVGPTANETTKGGWTVGGGIETRLSRSWTAKTEYLYVDVGNSNFASTVATAGPTGPAIPTTFDHSFHVIKTGLNYKIGEPFLDGLPLFGTSSTLPSNHNWNGFYVGLNVGGGISNVHALGGAGFVGGGTEMDVNGTGFAGGAQAGYNYVLGKTFLGTWVVGVEADYGYLGIRGSQVEWNDAATFADKTSWYSTARARIGTTTGPAFLYFTGGAAWVRLTDTLALGATSQLSRTASGWTFGGGTEVALDQRWSARIESLYIDAGHDNLAVGAANGDFKDRFTVVRAGISAKIGD
jgi:outer membrane immunogenic protein